MSRSGNDGACLSSVYLASSVSSPHAGPRTKFGAADVDEETTDDNDIATVFSDIDGV